MRKITESQREFRNKRCEMFGIKCYEINILSYNIYFTTNNKDFRKERIQDIKELLWKIIESIFRFIFTLFWLLINTTIVILDGLFAIFIVSPLMLLYIIFFKIFMLDNLHIVKIVGEENNE